MRLIDADALASALNNGRLEEQTGRAVPFNAGVAFALTMVEYAPTADVAPVRHGRWIEHYKSDAPPTLKERWICSWCGNVQTYGITDYCPNCGAKMDEGKDNEIDD